MDSSPFTSKEISSNIEKSATNLGINGVKGPENKEPAYFAKANCKTCWGQGILAAHLNGQDGAFSRKGTIYCKCVRKAS